MYSIYLGILLFFLIFSLAALFFATSIIIGLLMAKGVPFVSLPKQDWSKMCQVAHLQPGQIVYDLGCGKANLLIIAVKEFKVRGVGYEISLWPYVWGKIRSWFNGIKIDLRLKNFLTADIKEADVVFCYLFTHAMAALEPKFERELKSGAKVVSYAFKLPNRKPDLIIDGNIDGTGKIYIYNY